MATLCKSACSVKGSLFGRPAWHPYPVSCAVSLWDNWAKEKCTLKWVSPSKYAAQTLRPDAVYFSVCLRCPLWYIMLKVFSFRKYFNLSWFCRAYMKKDLVHIETISQIALEMYLFSFHIAWIIYVVCFASYQEEELRNLFFFLVQKASFFP